MTTPTPRFHHHFVVVGTTENGVTTFTIDDDVCDAKFKGGYIWDEQEMEWTTVAQAGIEPLDIHIANDLRRALGLPSTDGEPS